MNNDRIDFLTPVGRLVGGSLYRAKTTSMSGEPLVYKTGANAGQPRQEFYFALAIPKGAEQSWTQTEWGAIIYQVAVKGFPGGQFNSAKFAWKIKDGDNAEVNDRGERYCDRQGHAGHWILNYASSIAPEVVTSDGKQQIQETDAVNLGDYIQVYGSVAPNGATAQPGIYLNHRFVALLGYGQRIVIQSGPAASEVGFGGSLPPGATAIPQPAGFNPASMPTPPVVGQVPAQALPPQPMPVQPYHQILTPGAPVTAQAYQAPVTPPLVNAPPVPPMAVPQRVMTGPYTYEQLIAAGYTDAAMISAGYMKG